jgi:hypothetical protein
MYRISALWFGRRIRADMLRTFAALQARAA